MPLYANGDPTHPDCKHGVVSYAPPHKQDAVFVKYDRPGWRMETGDEQVGSRLTYLYDLVKENDNENNQ